MKGTESPILARVGEWIFRFSLLAYPKSFRVAMEADLLATHRQVCHEKFGAGLWKALAFLIRSPFLSVRDGLFERMAKPSTNRPGQNGRPSGGWWHDVHVTLRQSIRSPGFLLTAALTFAVGIGATTTVFTVVDNVLLRPLPYPSSHKLVQVGSIYPGSERLGSISLPNFRDIVTEATTFEGLSTIRGVAADVTVDEGSERIPGAGVSSSFFTLLRVTPALGRLFVPEDDAVNATRSAILSHALWMRVWGGRRNIIGEPVVINGQPHVVVGVLPGSFEPPEGLGVGDVAIWLPQLTPFLDRPLTDRGWGLFRVLGRVREGQSMEAAEGQLDLVASALAEEYPEANTIDGSAVRLQTVRLLEQTVSNVSTTLVTLLGAVTITLLIAVANLTNLLIVRSLERRTEFALKRALGSPNSRVVRPVIFESVLVTVVGGAVGLVLAVGGVAAFRSFSPGDIPRLEAISVDLRIVAVAMAISLVMGVLAGLLPALRSLHHDPIDTLRGTPQRLGNTSSGAVRKTLVTVQTALAMTLSVGAGLLINSFARLTNVDPGFEANNVTLMQIYLGNPDVPGSADRRNTFARLMTERLRTMPGVTSVATTMSTPLQGTGSKGDIPYSPVDQPEVQYAASFMTWISSDYFRTLGIPLIEGRDFNENDVLQGTEPAVIVNEELARQTWGGVSVVGKQFSVGGRGRSSRQYRVVGVAANVRTARLDQPDVPSIYYLDTGGIIGPPLTFIVRSPLGADRIVPLMRRAANDVDSTVPIGRVGPLGDYVSSSVARPRFYTLVLTAFAVVAISLSAIGVYGALAYSVNQRRREVGVRMACGAARSGVVWLVLRQGLVPVGLGIGAGLGVATASMRTLSQFLFDVSVADPLTLTTTAVVLLAVATAACLAPAIRAARMDPMRTLSE